MLYIAVEKLNGYVTGVHLLIKKENVPIVKQTLENNSMAFEVLMDDLQRAIDTENPPIDEDSFDNRKGNRKFRYISPIYIRNSIDIYFTFFISALFFTFSIRLKLRKNKYLIISNIKNKKKT